MSYIDTKLFIDGQWCDSSDGKTLAVVNPASGKEIGRVAHATIADLDRALASSLKGFEIWRKVSAVERGKIMRQAAQLLRERATQIGTLMTLEQGKPLVESKGEIMMAAEVTEWFAEEGRRVYGRVVPPRDFSVNQSVIRQPVGPVAAFTPWNFPINQVIRKLAAALATGCSIIVKAPEETPASPAALIQVFIDAGVPTGVINLVYGNPAQISEYLIPHPIIRKITFTGSTPVGKQLAAMAGLHMKRATMELGGHAPVIVAEDADVELAAKAISGAKFRNAGQVCISPTRFLVHQDVEAQFVKALVQQTSQIKVGDGLAEGTNMGPLANTRRLQAISQFVEDAVQAGATIATGGQRIGEVGNFFAPTVLTNINPNSRVFNEEPFGPIAAVKTFTSLDEAIREANRLAYGLAGYAFTKSVKNAHQLSQDLQVGMVWINQPPMAWPEMHFGGINDSGYGSEGGIEGLEAYLNLKSVSIKSI